MEDYDVFNEMQEIKDRKTVIVIEDDEDFIVNNLLNSAFEIIPIRFSYDLSNFSKNYIEKTKELFTFYCNEQDNFENELLRLKKHFIHYQRKPVIAYIPNVKKYTILKKMLNNTGIKIVSSKSQLMTIFNKKLILIDSDETLKKSDGTISKRLKKAIQDNRKKGNVIIVCTSRPRYQALDVMRDIGADCIIVSSNGSEIYDSKTNKIIYNSFINKKLINELVEDAYLKDIRLILSIDDYDYVTKEKRNENQKILSINYIDELANCNVKQCMFIDKKQDDINRIKESLSNNGNIHIVDEINENSTYEEKWFSISNSNCSKGTALKFLSDYLNIPIKNTIAIGNDKNDLSMFDIAGLSVAVANASDSIKSQVDYITLSNDEDGVAIFLESLL